MIQPYQWIKKHGPKFIHPYNLQNTNSASHDLTLHPTIIAHTKKTTKTKTLPQSIKPNQFILASTNEIITLPNNIAAQIMLKSTIGRQGINHALAGWIDPGFSGQITLELHNINPKSITLQPNQKIAQIIFHKLTAPTTKPYKGRYQNQKGPTPQKKEIGRTM